MSEEPMTLERALSILCTAHTRDDDNAGYVVEIGPPMFYAVPQAEYVEAWGVVRKAARFRTEPGEYPTLPLHGEDE